jgi:hypothetical protein
MNLGQRSMIMTVPRLATMRFVIVRMVMTWTVALVMGHMIVISGVMVAVVVRIEVAAAPRGSALGKETEPGGRHPGFENPLGNHLRARRQQGINHTTQLGERQSNIQQRAEDHVASGAREAVEVKKLHWSASSLVFHGGPYVKHVMV